MSDEAKELIRGMLELDPKKRLTAKQVLTHPWIADPKCPPESALDAVVFERFKQFAGMTKFKKMGLKAMASNLARMKCGPEGTLQGFTRMAGTLSEPRGIKLTRRPRPPSSTQSWLHDLDGKANSITRVHRRHAREIEATVEVASPLDCCRQGGDGPSAARSLRICFRKCRRSNAPISAMSAVRGGDADGDGRIDFDEFMAMMNEERRGSELIGSRLTNGDPQNVAVRSK